MEEKTEEMTEETIKETITPGKRIRTLCEEQGISQKELAEKTGVSPSQISRIIKEETKTINSDLLVALAQAFGVTADWILGLEGEAGEAKDTADEEGKTQTAAYLCC